MAHPFIMTSEATIIRWVERFSLLFGFFGEEEEEEEDNDDDDDINTHCTTFHFFFPTILPSRS